MSLFTSSSVRAVERYVKALNARDADAIAKFIAPNCRMVDSRGDWIEGYDTVLLATRRFIELEPDFTLHVEHISQHGEDILLRGHVDADHPELSKDCLWLARVDNGQIAYWQNFAPGEPPALARIVIPEMARSDDYEPV
jgi:ketosteroid isomerase-like protein